MCGRFALGIPKKKLEEWFGTSFPDFPDGDYSTESQRASDSSDIAENWNISPGQWLRAVYGNGDGARHVGFFRWGLVPSWAKEDRIGYKMFNARCETVAAKPAFRTAFRRRRCLIPTQGFYEWTHPESGKKTPYFFEHAGGEPLAFAGLYEAWTAPDGSLLPTTTVITCAANGLVEQVHDRMPVFIGQAAFDTWLFGTPNEAHDLLRPCADTMLTMRPLDPVAAESAREPAGKPPRESTDDSSGEPSLLSFT